jgi:hypothetical protein
MGGVSAALLGKADRKELTMSAEEENKRLALIVIEALNARDLDHGRRTYQTTT